MQNLFFCPPNVYFICIPAFFLLPHVEYVDSLPSSCLRLLFVKCPGQRGGSRRKKRVGLLVVCLECGAVLTSCMDLWQAE